MTLEVKQVDAATMAFPASVIEDGLLPKWEDIPQHFRKRWTGGDKWVDLFDALFYRGGKPGHDLMLMRKPGIDGLAAIRQIRACMGSFEPKHEHKTAGCAYMLSEWFDGYEWVFAPDGQKGSRVIFA